jgi:hypothetical protein
MVHRKRGAFALSMFVVGVAMLAGGASAQARTTGAHIFNLTGAELKLSEIAKYSEEPGAKVWAEDPPHLGQVLQPGEELHIEIERPVISVRHVTLKYTAPGIGVTIFLEDAEYPECHVSGPLQCKVEGGRVELLEPPGSVHVVNAEDLQDQARALKTLCTDGNECEFEPQKTLETFTPQIVYGKTVTNCAEKGGPIVETEISAATTVTTSNSVGLSAKAAFDVFEIFQVAITLKYEHKRSVSEEFKQAVKVKVEPEKVGWIDITAPVIRDTGEFTLKLGNTEWKIQNVSFDSPDTSGKRAGDFAVDYEQLTPEQDKAECPHKRTGSGNPLEGQTPTSAALVQTEDKGTDSADLMSGGSESNTLQGLGGHDLLRGGAGDDTLLGGSGRDFIKGGPGEDTIAGGPGPDRIDDNSGPTVVSTGANTGPEGDRVDVADGQGDDTVTCDTPQTTVIVDPGDEVEGQCGQVIREGS